MNILGLGLPELIVVALILLLFFGPKRLPGLFKSIGTSVRELKNGLKDEPDSSATEENNNSQGTSNEPNKSDTSS